MMNKWIAGVVRHRVTVLVLCGLLTIAAAVGLTKLRFYNKLTEWMPKDDPQLALYHETSNTFSANNIVLVLVRPKAGVFTAETLGKIRELTETLKNRTEIFSVTSLSSVADIKKIDEGIEVRDFLDDIPSDPAGLAALEALARSKDRYIGQVLSEDGEWLALSVYISNDVETIAAVEDVVIPVTEDALAGTMDVYFTGMPTDGHFINQHTRRDLVFLVPVMLAAIVLILYLNLRTWKGLIPPVAVVVLSNIWLFGLIGWSGRPMTIITPAAPVLLLALGSAYGLYVVNKIRSDVESGAAAKAVNRQAAVIASAAAVAVPILYAAGTDIVGFLTFRGVKLSLIADFGVFSAIGLFLAAVLAVTLLPALAATLDFGTAPSGEPAKATGLTRFLDRAARLIIRRPGRIVAVFAVVMAVGLAGIPRVYREVGMAGFYTKTSMPRKAMEIANLHFNGAYPQSIYFEADEIRDPARLRLIRRSESFLSGLPRGLQPLGVPDLIEELNDSMNDRRALPETRAGVENLWLFLEGRGEITPLITPDGRETIVYAKISDSTTAFSEDLYARTENFVRSEAELRPVRVAMDSLPPAEAENVREAEAGFLAEELSWAARDKGGPAPDSGGIKTALLAGWKKPLPAGDAGRAVSEKLLSYCLSPSFPFEAGERELRAISEDWTKLAVSTPDLAISAEEAAGIVKRHIKPADFEADLASDAAASAAYLARETGENFKVEAMRGELRKILPRGSSGFEMRVSSILYDLVDNLAVVPAAGAPSGAEPVSFLRAAQTGYPVLTTKLSESLFTSQIRSIVLAFTITLILMMLMRKSIALGFLSILPIGFATVVMYGLLGFARIPLDYATMLTGSISIGVGIDYTIHFLYVVTEEIRAGHLLPEAIRLAFIERGRAMFSNTAAVTAGFSALLLSSLVLLRSFGGVMVLSLLFCFLGAMTLLPAAMLVFKPRALRPKKNSQGGSI